MSKATWTKWITFFPCSWHLFSSHVVKSCWKNCCQNQVGYRGVTNNPVQNLYIYWWLSWKGFNKCLQSMAASTFACKWRKRDQSHNQCWIIQHQVKFTTVSDSICQWWTVVRATLSHMCCSSPPVLSLLEPQDFPNETQTAYVIVY